MVVNAFYQINMRVTFKELLKSLVLLFAFLVITDVRAQQIKSFTPEPDKFPQEMKAFLTEADKKQSDDVMEPFLEAWKLGKFNADQQKDIYSTANAMLKKRMRAFPDFSNYITTLTSFANSSQSAESFKAWQTSVSKLLTLPTKNFAFYISVCSSLFRSNTLYESASTNWHADVSNYQFDFDSLPKIVFNTFNLTCSSKGDSSTIFGTKGVYYPNLHTFYGDGGTVYWTRAGFDQATVNAKLNTYSIDVTGSDYTADSVVFIDKSFLKQPLVGKFSDKLIAAVRAETAIYPRFESYTASIEIKDIVPDVNYRGGFSLSGSKIIASGNKDQNAEIYFYRNKKIFLRSSSRGFVIRQERITSENAAVAIYYEADSIYHPGIEFKYMVKQRELSLFRGTEGKSRSPYYDSYHKVDIYADALTWKIDEPLLDMKMVVGAGESKAVLESANLFNRERFAKIQGISEVHPLYSVKQYAESHGSREVYTEDLAKSMRLPVSEVRVMLIDLSNQGFVTYESTEDKAIVKDRLYYYLSANTGKTDFDVIQFQSVIKEKPNISINLLNFEITMRGVSRIALSDSQNVILFPKDGEIKIQKNRNFTFAGLVKAGRFDFFGKEFSFDYDTFKVNLNNVDSLRLKVEREPAEFDEYGNPRLTSVRSVLENINGDLLIDAPSNKSGRYSYAKFPVFNSKKDSYVYYDKSYIQQGVYNRNNFYFHLDPFTIDSLDNFSKAGLAFAGDFISAGIFPDLRDTLKLQPDLSLGLKKNTGEQGWAAYGGKGKFVNKISLSNEGLHGDGTLEYLASVSHSKDFLFLPDSMNSIATDFSNPKGLYKEVEFPQASVGKVYLHWMPKSDVMHVDTLGELISMYEGQSKLAGGLQLKPTGMTGKGIMGFAQSELEANKFKYKLNSFNSDTADFRLNTPDSSALAFASKNVKSNIDFTNRVGEFKSNGSGSYVTFPVNKYICYIDQFKWFMDKQEIEMTSSTSPGLVAGKEDTDLGLTGSEFISIAPEQDSLRFKAPYARYSLHDYLIKAEKVAVIRTADASVIPDSGKVVVEKDAHIRTLTNARILANNISKYHSLFNATVDILGRKNYEGSADYNYIDENKNKHLIHFSVIEIDTALQTTAYGELKDTAEFPLSTQFAFKGDVKLLASAKNLTFSGYAKPNFRCDKIEKNWIRFTASIDPENVRIPIVAPVTDNGVVLSASVAQSSDSTGIYSAFLKPKLHSGDKELIASSGLLMFDKTSKEFKITSAEKLEKFSLPGNYLSLNDNSCLVYGEGMIDFASDFGQVKLQTTGSLVNNLNNDNTTFDLIVALDFFFNEESLKAMAEFFENSGTLKPTQEVGRKSFEKGIAELVGKEKADKMVADLNLYGSFKKIPEELRHTIFISELNLGWNNDTRSFRSTGPIGISSMGKTSIGKRVNGTVEIVRKRSGDVITIYLEPENGTWFFFTYTRGVMQGVSTLTSFNDAVEKEKPDKRLVKGGKDQDDYEYMLSTDRKVRDFLRKMNPPPEEEQK